MKNLLLNLFVLIFFIHHASAQDSTRIVNALFELPDVIFKEIPTRGGSAKTFELKIKQLLDHKHPEKGYFYQRAFLSHRDMSKPMVMYLSGYSQARASNTEITRILGANQLSVEHRFFGTSLPDSIDYAYLTLEQASADFHYINELFKKIYTGKWLSTGVSKGGATVVIYKYFYPNDVDACVPYVAPINKERVDKRFDTFLNNVGTEGCRAKILAFQKRMLQHRDEVLPLLKTYSEEKGYKFTYMSFEEAFEYSVLEYQVAFWQYGSLCEEIPSDTTSIASAVKYLMKVSNIRTFSDVDIDYFLPHYYQSANQMGYYSYATENLKDDLKILPIQPYPYGAILPKNWQVDFDGSTLKKINDWVQKKGNRMMYVYGATDFWTATAVPKTDKVDAVWFVLKGKSHGANFGGMTPEEKKLFISTLERWLALKIDYTEKQ